MSPWVLGDLALLSPLWLLPALLCLALAARPPRRLRRDGWRAVMSSDVLGFLGHGPARRGLRAGLLCAALAGVALAEPATRQSDAATWRHATAWIAIVDVSRSMTLDDIAPSRLAAARDATLALSVAAGARPMALLVFAGDAFLVSPPAFDHTVLDAQASLLEHGTVPVAGSNIARALSLASSVASGSGLVAARLFLLGDSAGASRNALAAARFVANAGHRLDVLQFGRAGSDVPPGGAVDLGAAERLAEAGGGRLLLADGFGALALDALDLGDDRADIAGLEAVLWQGRGHWFLLPLLVALPWMQRTRAAR